MASTMDKLAKELKAEMTASDERKPKPYDTQAEVVRVEGGTAWVHIPGGVDETPVRLTINARKGDMVNVHVADGTAWITGNSTNPPTDDRTANNAINISTQVQNDVVVLNTVVTENIEATNARFTNVEIDTAKVHELTADQLTASVGYIEDLTADNITANDISAASGYIKDLEADNITVQNISAATGYIGDLTSEHITVNDIVATTGYIDDLTAGNVTAQNVIADHATVGSLDANYAKINAANIDTATIRNAWVDKIMVQTGLLAYSSQIYTLDAIEVNAANITAGTLDVNRLIVTVGEGSSAQKYLVNIDPSTGTPSYEKLDGNIVEPRTITANKIVANSITTDEITVNNLVGTSGWINLHEGKFFYGNGADFATSANAISWNGSKLQIKADEFLLSTGKTIQDSIESVENWFYSVPPTTSNAPASSWTTTNLKEQHLRDIYFDTTSGKSYRWSKDNNVYSWVEIEDVELAALAKDLHDNYPPRSEFTVAPNQIQAVVTSETNARKAIYGTCGTAAGTTAKVVTCANFARYTGAVVTVKFTNANTATTPTLNVNSTGAATIKSYKGDALAEAEYKWAAGSTLSFVFDGTYWRLQDSGSTAQIKVNADNINLRVQKNDVINQINVSTEGAQIKATKVDIAGATVFNNYSTTSQMNTAIGTAVDGIEVGGRNYIRNTGTFDGWTNCGSGTAGTFNSDGTYTFPSTSADGWTEIRPNNNVSYAYVKDCEVVLSAEVKGTSGQTISVMLDPYLSASATGDRTKYRNVYLAVDGGGVSQKTVTADGTWQKVYAIVTINDAFFSSGSGSGDYFGLRAARVNTNHNSYSIRKIKLEKGNKATDWAPAPEDATEYTDSAVNGIEVGGRNRAALSYIWNRTASTYTTNGVTVTNLGGGKFSAVGTTTNIGDIWWCTASGVSTQLGASGTYTYTISLESGTMPSNIGLQVAEANSSGSWQRNNRSAGSATTYTFSTNAGNHPYHLGFCAFAANTAINITFRLKFEIGNKATDWSPAPEDVQAEIDAKRSVWTLKSSSSGSTYANILNWTAEGQTGSSWGINTTETPIDKIKVGDTVRVAYKVTDMGTTDNRPYVYVIGTFESSSGSTVYLTMHGLDTTIIDGGNILTNSIGANQIKANSISTSKLAVGDWTNLVTANELYPDSLPASSVSISNGYLVKTTATQQYILLTRINPRTPNNFKKGDELYVEFYAKAASATTATFSIYGYDSSNTYLDGNSALINGSTSSTTFNIPTTETKFSGTITLTRPAWDTAAYYEIDLNNNASTKVQIYMRKVVVRKKSAGELIVDGSITTDKLAANSITVGKMNSDTQSQVLNSNINIGGRNLLPDTGSSAGYYYFTGTGVAKDSWTNMDWDSSEKASYVTYTGTGATMVGQLGFVTENLVAGDSYTLSGDIKVVSTNSLQVGAQWRDQTNAAVTLGVAHATTDSNNAWKHFVITATFPTSVATTDVRITFIKSGTTSGNWTVYLKNVKLEKGNKVTDWSPAPEDATTYTDDAVNGIEVGGRNLLLKTAIPATGTMASDTNAQLNPYNMVKSYSELGLTTDDYVTISFDYSYTNGKAGGTIKVGTNAVPWEYFGTLITTTAGSNSGHIESSFKVSSGLAASTGNNLRIRTDNCNGMTLTVSNAKLEKGNKATDWTPTPEEMAATATNYISADSSGIRIASASPSTQKQRMQLTSSEAALYSSDDKKRVSVTANTGVVVGDSEKGHTTVNDSGLRVFVDNTNNDVASFGSSARIGPTSKPHVDIKSTSISMSDGSRDVYSVSTSSGKVKVVCPYDFKFYYDPYGDAYEDTINIGRTVSSWTKITLAYKVGSTAKTQQYTTFPINDTSGKYYFEATISGSTVTIYIGRGTGASTSEVITITSVTFEFNTSQQVAESTIGAFADTTYSGAFRVGNGTSTSAKSNAMLLDWSGNLRLKGDIFLDCDQYSNGGLSLTQRHISTCVYTSTYVEVDMFQVGMLVMLDVYIDKDSSTAAGANYVSASLANKHIPAPMGAAATGIAFNSNVPIALNIWMSDNWTITCRNVGSAALSSTHCVGTITYIWNGKYTDDPI